MFGGKLAPGDRTQLGLTLTIEREGKLSTKLHYKHDDFCFQIVNFPFLSLGITSGPYDVHIS